MADTPTPIYLDGGSHNNGSCGFARAPYRHSRHEASSSTTRLGLIVQGHVWEGPLDNLAEGEQGVYIDGTTANAIAINQMLDAGMSPDIVDQFAASIGFDLTQLAR